MEEAPDAKPIVDALGGPAKVARHLKSTHPRGHISRAAVCQWKRVPQEHCSALADLQGDNGEKFTPSDMRPDLEWVNVNGTFYARERAAA
jgi:hypothetical protein